MPERRSPTRRGPIWKSAPHGSPSITSPDSKGLKARKRIAQGKANSGLAQAPSEDLGSRSRRISTPCQGDTNSPQQPRLVLPRQLVFPNAQHAPASSAKLVGYETVAGFVGGEFTPPERAVAGWGGRVLRTAVPETAVHKQREACLPEHEIRFAEHRRVTTPARDAVRSK